MSLILNIETSSRTCSVCLSKNGEIINYQEDVNTFAHAEALFVFIQSVLQNHPTKDLSAVAVSAGPGSYTGLRIGVSAAKGLCYGLQIPLIAISTLQIVAQQARSLQQLSAEDQIAVCIDARRMEVFCGVLDAQCQILQDLHAIEITPDFMQQALSKGRVLFAGNSNDKIKSVLTHPNALFTSNIEPTAKDMPFFSHAQFEQKRFVDLAYFEPEYGKAFYTNSK
jgi:tRNA threonylcarbamoyladenosine biosynthesis protein TsaB